MAYKLVISKPGHNALNTGLADKNKIFDSSLNHLKTFASGSFTQTVANNGQFVGSVTHSLGYHPLCTCYFSTDNTNYRISLSGNPTVSPVRYSLENSNVGVYTTTSLIYFVLTNDSGSSKTFVVKYEIFYEGD